MLLILLMYNNCQTSKSQRIVFLYLCECISDITNRAQQPFLVFGPVTKKYLTLQNFGLWAGQQAKIWI